MEGVRFHQTVFKLFNLEGSSVGLGVEVKFTCDVPNNYQVSVVILKHTHRPLKFECMLKFARLTATVQMWQNDRKRLKHFRRLSLGKVAERCTYIWCFVFLISFGQNGFSQYFYITRGHSILQKQFIHNIISLHTLLSNYGNNYIFQLEFIFFVPTIDTTILSYIVSPKLNYFTFHIIHADL
jgi:hypothetical protein